MREKAMRHNWDIELDAALPSAGGAARADGEKAHHQRHPGRSRDNSHLERSPSGTGFASQHQTRARTSDDWAAHQKSQCGA